MNTNTRITSDVPPEAIPYLAMQERNVSTKSVVTTIATSVSSIGLIGLLWYIVIRLFNSLSEDALRIGAITLLAIFLILLAMAGTFGLVLIFRAISMPGKQLGGFLGKLEDKFER